MCTIKLSPRQEEIASFTEGALLVRASAGSGKTRVLTERICRLAKITRRQILAITFTNKASEEIKNRLSDIDENLLDKVFVSTFHGLCESILESKIAYTRYQSMPQIFTEDDRKQILEDTIMDNPELRIWYGKLGTKDKSKKLQEALNIISRIKREVIRDSELHTKIKDRNMRSLYIYYREHMDSINAIDFDDLLYNVCTLFGEQEWIAEQYRRNFTYICVDEAQDMNRAQYMVLRALTGNSHHNVMLVGDSKQSIYGFNGSSSDFMDKYFLADFNPTKIDLFENYRSAKSILRYADKIIPDAHQEMNVVAEGICKERAFTSPCSEACHVVAKIKELLTTENLEYIDGRVEYQDIAILARNKFVLSKIEEQLKAENMPYHYKVTASGPDLTSTSAMAFILCMIVKENEHDMLHLQQLIDLLKIKKAQSLMEIQNKLSNAYYMNLINLAQGLSNDGSNFKNTISCIIDLIKQQKNNSSLEQQELLMAYDDFHTIKEHWNKYAKQASTLSLMGFRNAMMLGQTSMQETSNSIVLSTVHTMKGQQSLIVFLVGMDDLTFPDYRAVNNEEMLSQERNNLYVAVTRAQRYLFISYPTERIMPWGDKMRRNRSRLLPAQTLSTM